MASVYPRDMVGYGRNPPDSAWPGGARIAVQFVVNYEERGENNVLPGDAASEAFLSEIVRAGSTSAARRSTPSPSQRRKAASSIPPTPTPTTCLTGSTDRVVRS